MQNASAGFDPNSSKLGFSASNSFNKMLVFQFTDQFWQVPLSYSGKMEKLFEDDVKVVPLHAIRKLRDTDQICVATSSTMKSAVVKLKLNAEDPDNLAVTEVFESGSSKIVLLEHDPTNFNNIMIADDEQMFYKITERSDEKSEITLKVNMAHHSLDDELEALDEKEWSKVPINDRVVTLVEYSFSLQSKVFWRSDPEDDAQTLV